MRTNFLRIDTQERARHDLERSSMLAIVRVLERNVERVVALGFRFFWIGVLGLGRAPH